MIAAMIAGALLKNIEKKTILISGIISMLVCDAVNVILLLSIAWKDHHDGVNSKRTIEGIFIFCFNFIFLLAYGVSVGPISFIYAAQLCSAQQLALAISTNWFS
jgi:hypothetical protein